MMDRASHRELWPGNREIAAEEILQERAREMREGRALVQGEFDCRGIGERRKLPGVDADFREQIRHPGFAPKIELVSPTAFGHDPCRAAENIAPSPRDKGGKVGFKRWGNSPRLRERFGTDRRIIRANPSGKAYQVCVGGAGFP